MGVAGGKTGVRGATHVSLRSSILTPLSQDGSATLQVKVLHYPLLLRWRDWYQGRQPASLLSQEQQSTDSTSGGDGLLTCNLPGGFLHARCSLMAALLPHTSLCQSDVHPSPAPLHVTPPPPAVLLSTIPSSSEHRAAQRAWLGGPAAAAAPHRPMGVAWDCWGQQQQQCVAAAIAVEGVCPHTSSRVGSPRCACSL